MLLFEIAGVYKQRAPIINKMTGRKEAISIKFINLVSQHVNVERSLSYYANRLSVSSNYLTKITKATFQQSAGSYIDAVVIERSKVLLSHSGSPIGLIASELNFSDQFIFSKFFKKRVGLTPTRYREIKSKQNLLETINEQ